MGIQDGQDKGTMYEKISEKVIGCSFEVMNELGANQGQSCSNWHLFAHPDQPIPFGLEKTSQIIRIGPILSIFCFFPLTGPLN